MKANWSVPTKQRIVYPGSDACCYTYKGSYYLANLHAQLSLQSLEDVNEILGMHRHFSENLCVTVLATVHVCSADLLVHSSLRASSPGGGGGGRGREEGELAKCKMLIGGY